MSEIKNNGQEMNQNELEKAAGGASGGYFVYTVVKGDTLGRIASAYGVTVRDLVRWNNIADPNLILIGQKLRIY